MENSHQIKLILRVLSGEDELRHDPELEEFKSDPANQKQIQEWKQVFGEAASLLEEMKAWEEMPAEQKEQIVQKAVQTFRETVGPKGTPVAADEILLEDESHQVVSMEICETVTPDGIPGWIVAADDLAPGVVRVRITEEGKGRLLARDIAEVTIPSVSSETISSEALAGRSVPEYADTDIGVGYTAFRAARDAAGAEHHLRGQVEGYVVPQQHGVRVVAFIPKSLSEESGGAV